MLTSSLRSCVVAAYVALCGCATPIDDKTDFAVVVPSRSTSIAEISSAIQDLIKTYPVCVPLRPLRLVGLPVNFDPNSRKAPPDDDAEQELDVLVHLGYLTKTAVPELGARGFRFDRTERGKDTNIVGTSSFCLPAERVLVSVTKVERETRDSHIGLDGYLVVEFTHKLDASSVWAREPALLKLVAGERAFLPPGPVDGRAQLSRVWMRSEHPLKGAPHSGALWAVSWDPVHNRWEGGRWGALNVKVWDAK